MRFGAAGEHRALLLVSVRTHIDVSVKLDEKCKKKKNSVGVLDVGSVTL